MFIHLLVEAPRGLLWLVWSKLRHKNDFHAQKGWIICALIPEKHSKRQEMAPVDFLGLCLYGMRAFVRPDLVVWVDQWEDNINNFIFWPSERGINFRPDPVVAGGRGWVQPDWCEGYPGDWRVPGSGAVSHSLPDRGVQGWLSRQAESEAPALRFKMRIFSFFFLSW